jgi:hypothetical protein
MPLTSSEILWKKSILTSKTVPAQNGGRMGTDIINTGVKNNIFPDVSQSERLTGKVDYRKVFVHLASAEEGELANGRFSLSGKTPAESFVLLRAGTQTDTEAEIAAYRQYGVANPASAISAAATTFTLTGEHADYEALEPFQVGDTLVFTEGANTETAVIDSIVYDGATMLIDVLSPLDNQWTIAAVVASCLPAPSLVASATVPVVTSVAGLCAGVMPHNKGGIEQVWTLTFTSATSYTVSGDTVGLFPISGNVSSDFAPNNPVTGTPYFTLKEAGLTGIFALNEKIVFTTHPAAQPLWYCRHIPANCASLSNDSMGVIYVAEVV